MPLSPVQTELAAGVRDARQRTLDLVADLDDDQLRGPRLAIINPLIWEIGHVAWFQEKWILRRNGAPSLRSDADALYDSIAIPHDVRWDLPLPSRQATVAYLTAVRDRVLELIESREPTEEDVYFIRLAVFHEDMHDEAFTYTRQTLGYPPPRFTADVPARPAGSSGPLPGYVELPGGSFLLGAAPGRDRFVFDNEKWAHLVEVRPFLIARAPVTQAEFAAFVEDGGYRRREWWSAPGWRWKEASGAMHPVYWKREGRQWLRRHFDEWRPLEPHQPVIHVNYYEAGAYCRWAGCRLPTEVEWEMAAATEPDRAGDRSADKRPFPWGSDAPSPDRANLDWQAGGPVDVAAHGAGDSAWGCRQMIGNVWEWTSSVFGPYPGFVPDPYKEYSAPWFGDHMVLRGGAWTTRSRLLRNTWRNFYKPDRRDVLAGFRTARDAGA